MDYSSCVTCPQCQTIAEEHVSGPASKNPGRIYFSCPCCPSKTGVGKLFIKFGPYSNNIPTPSNTLPPLKRTREEKWPLFPPKVQKTETSMIDKNTIKKIDEILYKVNAIFETIFEEQEENKTEEKD